MGQGCKNYRKSFVESERGEVVVRGRGVESERGEIVKNKKKGCRKWEGKGCRKYKERAWQQKIKGRGVENERGEVVENKKIIGRGVESETRGVQNLRENDVEMRLGRRKLDIKLCRN